MLMTENSFAQVWFNLNGSVIQIAPSAIKLDALEILLVMYLVYTVMATF